MTASPLTATLLEKSAADNGFDLELERVGEWLHFGSTHAPIEVWLTVDNEGHPFAGLSRVDVAQALAEHGEFEAIKAPIGVQAVRRVPDLAGLYRLLRRAYQLARSMPYEPLMAFEKAMVVGIGSTETLALTRQRVGQDIFRAGLLDYWEGRCAITRLAVPELLRASHIKPWANCATDGERLDVFNGLLLAPHLDALFDRGFITVADDGTVILAQALAADARQLLALTTPLRMTGLAKPHLQYLPWHREKVFKG